jgi:HEAT repeat protein
MKASFRPIPTGSKRQAGRRFYSSAKVRFPPPFRWRWSILRAEMSPDLHHGKESRNDPRSIEELVRLALTEPDEDAAWEAVTMLHAKGSREVLEAAKRLCASNRADERQLGANILGQLGIPDRTFPDECFATLAAMLAEETDPNVLECIGVAFGHLKDPRAVELLLPLKRHANSDVRFGVVMGLTGHERPDAIEAMIELSRDSEELVRTWATFSLGTIVRTDTPEIREALLARTLDRHDETRGEGLVGLALRKDQRVIEPLISDLSSGNVGRLTLEAAEAIGDPRLYPALVELKSCCAPDAPNAALLEDALASCAPR